MEARNQVGIGLSYRPASLRSLAIQFQTRFLESIPRPIAGLKFPTQATEAGESIPGLLKKFKNTVSVAYGGDPSELLLKVPQQRCFLPAKVCI